MDRMHACLISMLLPLFWPASSLALPGDGWNGMDNMMSWGWGNMMFGGVMMFIFWGGIILLIVLLINWLGSKGHSGEGDQAGHATPLGILKERFAKGEIDKKEYEERGKLLSE